MTPDALSALHHSAFTTPRPWSAAEVAALLSGTGVFWHGDANGFVMGRSVAGEAEILTLAVAPNQRRKGLARTLMQQFEAHACETGADTAFLEVAENNAAAAALYLSLGYAQVGRRRGYFETPQGHHIDALVMSKLLHPGI
ncbi:GNAT family N-acetyltransferase [Pseudorhodobacter ferrugineus]|uniref:GNAT family N-acetyltransferase n=1 Tax=Pseudorhodobacter ferrugineus TaxID=77008 RepID=UPI0003B4FCF4|nr:GNAT family N-acetyltransferase [Pseudorhodobacter ferrugineus]